jgi:hypothetical protein
MLLLTFVHSALPQTPRPSAIMVLAIGERLPEKFSANRFLGPTFDIRHDLQAWEPELVTVDQSVVAWVLVSPQLLQYRRTVQKLLVSLGKQVETDGSISLGSLDPETKTFLVEGIKQRSARVVDSNALLIARPRMNMRVTDGVTSTSVSQTLPMSTSTMSKLYDSPNPGPSLNRAELRNSPSSGDFERPPMNLNFSEYGFSPEGPLRRTVQVKLLEAADRWVADYRREFADSVGKLRDRLSTKFAPPTPGQPLRDAKEFEHIQFSLRPKLGFSGFREEDVKNFARSATVESVHFDLVISIKIQNSTGQGRGLMGHECVFRSP